MDAGAELRPLPRGRHRLTREEVEASQRVRLLRAMCDVMAEKGYVRTSVADVLGRARVSRETFYELFSSKEDCFMSAFELGYAAIAAGMAPPAPEVPAAGRLGRVLDDYLGALAADPAAARVFLIEVYAAGPGALERRRELHGGLVDAVAGLVGAASAEDRFAVEAFLAAVVQLVTARLAAGDVDGLRELRDPLLAVARRLGLGAPEAV